MSEPITNVEDAVAKLGALPVPVPVGPVPQRSELETLRARVAELEAERHVTNEALSDAAVRMRADRDRIAELERLIADAPASYALMDRVRAEADKLTRTFAPTQALREDDEFHLRHAYLKGRDFPGSGGAS